VSLELRDPPVGQWLSRNLPWFASIWLFVFVVIKILLAARLDLQTAFGLLQAGGPLNVTFAAVASGLQFLLLTVANLSIFLAVTSNKPWPSASRLALWATYASSSLLIVFTSDWLRGVTVAGLGLSWLIIWVGFERKGDRRSEPSPSEPSEMLRFEELIKEFEESPERKALIRVGELEDKGEPVPPDLALSAKQRASLEKWVQAIQKQSEAVKTQVSKMVAAMSERHLVLFLVALIVSVTPFVVDALIRPDLWLPAERLKASDGSELVGYVVGLDGDWMTILLEAERRLELLPKGKVVSRHVCSVSSTARRQTLVELIFRLKPRLRYPPCSDPGMVTSPP
jgi:hypothetical protein